MFYGGDNMSARLFDESMRQFYRYFHIRSSVSSAANTQGYAETTDKRTCPAGLESSLHVPSHGVCQPVTSSKNARLAWSQTWQRIEPRNPLLRECHLNLRRHASKSKHLFIPLQVARSAYSHISFGWRWLNWYIPQISHPFFSEHTAWTLSSPAAPPAIFTSVLVRKLDDTVVGALDLQIFLLISNIELSVDTGLPCEVENESNLDIDGDEIIFLKEFGESSSGKISSPIRPLQIFVFANVKFE